MKRLVPVLLLVAMLACLFAACEETPGTEAAPTNIEDVKWTIEVEGATKTSYSIDEAKTHDLTKAYVSGYNNSTAAQGAPQITTRRWDGVKVSDFLADVGVTDYTSLTFVDASGTTLEIEKKICDNDGSVLAWVESKNSVIPESTTYVAFGSAVGGKYDIVYSLTKVIVNK